MEFIIQKEVDPNFKSVRQTKEPYNILKGGRNLFKSSVIALLLIYMMTPYINQNEKANVVVIRVSMFNMIQWTIVLDKNVCNMSLSQPIMKLSDDD